MKRRLVEQGGTTLMVSLPSKWAKRLNLKKGDEVEVMEEGDNIFLGVNKEPRREKVSLDLKGLSANLVNRTVGATYKAGYDEIEIFYESPEELESIQTCIDRTCVGMGIVEETKNRILIKSLSKLEPAEFDSVLRRCFLSLIAIANESLDVIKKQDINGMKSMILKDWNINKASDFCRRALNKNCETKCKRKPPVYVVAEQLGKIGDMYKYFTQYNIRISSKLSKETLTVYELINKYLQNFYELFYNFDLKKLDEFLLTKKEIQDKIEKAIDKVPKQEIILLFYLNSISWMLYDLNGVLLTEKI